jgi:hypothetical protein
MAYGCFQPGWSALVLQECDLFDAVGSAPWPRCSPRRGAFSGFGRSTARSPRWIRIRKIDNETELAAVEDEVDAILRAELVRSGDRDEGASDSSALIAAGHRLDNLIHHRRMALAAKGSNHISK